MLLSLGFVLRGPTKNYTYLVWISVDFEMNHATISSKRSRTSQFISYENMTVFFSFFFPHENRDTLTSVAISITFYLSSIRKLCPRHPLRQLLILSSSETRLDMTGQISYRYH
jgi:hypothetical protein